MKEYKFLATIEQRNSIEYLKTTSLDPINYQDSLNELEYYENIVYRMEEEIINSYLLNYPIHLPDIEHIFINTDDTPNSINRKYNKILKENEGFDYFHWRKMQGLEKINFQQINISDNLHHVVGLKNKDIYYYINKITEVLLSNNISQPLMNAINNLQKRIHFIPGSDCCCVELPLSKKSYILLGEDNNINLLIIYLIHEIGHYIFNEFKFKSETVVNIETDEYWAHLIEIALVNEIFIDTDIIFYKKILEGILNENLLFTEFQHKLFLNPQNYYNLNSKNNLFKMLTKKYNINNNYDTSWMEDSNIFSNPFYTGSYVHPQLNAVNNIMKTNIYDTLILINSFFT